MSKNHPFHRCIVAFITICLFPLAAIAQAPDSTSRKGTTLRITTSTNNETFVKETKTEYFDKNGILKREVIQTKDLDGNSVNIVKHYDQTGMIKSRYETRRDKDGNIIYYEDLMYDEAGKMIFGKKREKRNDGKVFEFRFDAEKQKYDDGVIISSLTPPSEDPNQMYCNCPPLFLNAGYSYLKPGGRNSEPMPLGVEVGFGYRVNDRFNLIVDIGAHRRTENDQTWGRWNFLAGPQYEFKECDEQERISLFSRLMVGISLEQFKYNSHKSSGEAFAGALGAGVDVKLGPKFSLRINADWLASFFNSDLQSNFRIGGGLKFNLVDCQKLVN